MKSSGSFALLCLAASLGNLYFRSPQVLPVQAALLVGGWQCLVLSGVLWALRMTRKDWKKSGLIKGILTGVFLFSAGVDLMDLNRFYQTAYPGQIPGWVLALLMVGAAAVLAAGELRTLKHLTRIFFPLLAVSLALLFLSCAGLFHPANLTSWGWEKIGREMLSWRDLIPWPEYLALALWAPREGNAPLVWVPMARTGIHLFILTMAELALGSREALWPAQSLSLLGQLSVFNRLEWIQITVWLLLFMTRLSFYLYLTRSIWGRPSALGPAALVWTAFLALSYGQPQTVWAVQRAVLWGAAGILLLRGVCQWEKPSKRWPSAPQ